MQPIGTTHKMEVYGRTLYYKYVIIPHFNQVSEEWVQLARWYWWDNNKWNKAEIGFCSRRLVLIK